MIFEVPVGREDVHLAKYLPTFRKGLPVSIFTLLARVWKKHFRPKLARLSTKLHGVAFQRL